MTWLRRKPRLALGVLADVREAGAEIRRSIDELNETICANCRRFEFPEPEIQRECRARCGVVETGEQT